MEYSTSKKEKVAVYIDGNNFYKYLKNKEINFPKGVKFNFNKFIDYIIGNRECVSKRYYVGIARNLDGTDKSKQIVAGQQKFVSKMERDGFIIKRGRVMYDKGKIREKGTDVKMAVDLIIGAVDNIYDTAVLVSSDTDLIPAIKYVKYKQKKLEYVGFSHAPSFGIQKYANFTIILRQDDIEKFKEKTLL
ncbi:MAG: NYN domain-containing protein [Candidatus Staskawiczbacteria bacterium]|nr:NYN domain-containing protein [Candidatus Staskawiczbacteria bacterium]